MEKSIILLLFFSILLSAIGYYLGFIKPPKVFAWLAKSTFVFSTFFLIPLLAAVLWFQSGAEGRLEKTGFVPHPDIKEVIGIAFGTGANPVWIFKTASDEESIMNFYNETSSRPGWQLVSKNDSMLIFKKENIDK